MPYLYARISDNVLGEPDWPIAKVHFDQGVVVRVEEHAKGVYGMSDFVGKTIEDMALWTQHDSTGSHPEQYNELSPDPVAVDFRDFWSIEEIIDALLSYED